MNAVVVTALGFVTSIGNDRTEVLASLRAMRHGFEHCDLVPGVDLPVKVIGTVKDFDVSATNPVAWTWPAPYDLPRELVRGLPPHGVYAACALEQALAQSGRDALGDGATGLHCASAGSPRMLRHHLNRLANTAWQRGHPLGVVSSVAGALNFNLAARYGIRGANCGFVSACTSGSHALGYAFDEIAMGRQERMLVVAAEDVNAESLLPFAAMGALSLNADPSTASRPFDAARDGFVGTGGAAVIILENEARGGAQPLARMLGWAQASDGFHVAQPEPEGAGLRSTMERSLAACGVGAGEIDYVNAHATSTPAGDLAEALALRAVFTARGHAPAVSSTKGLTGHGLSLSGVMEAAFCVLALTEQFIPGNAHLREADFACAGLNLSRTSSPSRVRLALNNSSGFGGSNVCHIFSTP